MTEPDHKITGQYYFGKKDLYDYDCLRIPRKDLIRELRAMVKEAGIEIEYGQKFTKIVSEDADGVVFELADGRQERADLLIGADGIHSKVRSHLFPDIHPIYSGFMGVTYCFPRANLPVPSADFPLPVSIFGKRGAFVMSPQGVDGQEIFAGRQYKYDVQDRSGWDALLMRKDELIDLHQRDTKEWSPFVQAAQAQISTPEAHSVSIWPYYFVPKMQCWHSTTGRVVILGDAAHAVPPTAGQGANQSFEDSYSLAQVLARTFHDTDNLPEVLTAWETYRLERMDLVLALTDQVTYVRMSEEERAALPEEKRRQVQERDALVSDLSWLYNNDIDNDVDKLLGGMSAP
jgi:2-polyprenyl-6-methoxyphenol hydroxylase-like FAD-dependent oxidoreductase